MELYSMFCASLDASGVWGRLDTCVWMAKSLGCSPEATATMLIGYCCCCSVVIMSASLQLHGLQHARLHCPSPSLIVCSNSCPLSQWCHPTIPSSAVPPPQSFPTSGSFPMSQLFTPVPRRSSDFSWGGRLNPPLLGREVACVPIKGETDLRARVQVAGLWGPTPTSVLSWNRGVSAAGGAGLWRCRTRSARSGACRDQLAWAPGDTLILPGGSQPWLIQGRVLTCALGTRTPSCPARLPSRTRGASPASLPSRSQPCHRDPRLVPLDSESRAPCLVFRFQAAPTLDVLFPKQISCSPSPPLKSCSSFNHLQGKIQTQQHMGDPAFLWASVLAEPRIHNLHNRNGLLACQGNTSSSFEIYIIRPTIWEGVHELTPPKTD